MNYIAEHKDMFLWWKMPQLFAYWRRKIEPIEDAL